MDKAISEAMTSRFRRFVFFLLLLTLAVASASVANAQTCQTSSDLDDASRAPILAAAQRYFDMLAKGDAASLRQNAVPSLASDFSGVESLVKERQPDLAGAPAPSPKFFLLQVEGAAPLPHAEFLCGVFGKSGQSANSAAFYLDHLAPASYAVVLFDLSPPHGRTYVSFILQQAGSAWKLGGLYVKSAQLAGHDGDWFAARARDYKSKSQLHNAWLYAVEARTLLAPLPFMSTLATDQLDTQLQTLQPPDVPINGKTTDLPSATPAPGTTYKLIAMFPAAVGNDLDLIVKYQVTDISNTNQAFASNVAVMKTLVAKYPELKDAFAGIVARATDPSAHDYGTLLAMKDIK
jgi:hypothetical protein